MKWYIARKIPATNTIVAAPENHPLNFRIEIRVKEAHWINEKPSEKELPDTIKAEAEILNIARQIKLARKLDRMLCPAGNDGCPACRPLEAILRGEGELVWVNHYRQDVYILPKEEQSVGDSIVL